jgi:GNAT superfamily N-acetyltransferase
LVVLPDYQGIGIGTKFLIRIAEYYNKLGFDFSIVTSAKNLIRSLIKKKEFILTNYSTHKYGKTRHMVSLERTVRKNCKTASFFYTNK